MLEQTNNAIWQISNPAEWPKAPKWMSFSTLSELEACPRRWSLNTAEYPNIWNQQRYPNVPHLSTIEGSVVHLALKKIIQAFLNQGCTSLADKRTYLILKELGGFSAILFECLEHILRPYNRNPRISPVLDDIRQQLIAQIPDLRYRVQRIISRVSFKRSSSPRFSTNTQSENRSRHRLHFGSHAEVELHVPEIGWIGIADLLTLSRGFCEIRDFKTGVPQKHHEFQLLIYALLWASDQDLNPSGLLANKLVVSYTDRDVEVPVPDENELSSLKNDLNKRTMIVHSKFKLEPPEARPNQENCAYCHVRHLCKEYWEWLALSESTKGSYDNDFTDLQIKIVCRHGLTSWDGIIEASSIIKVGLPILLRSSKALFEFDPGQRLRILNVKVYFDQIVQSAKHELPLIIATVGTSTELFTLSWLD